jgi:SET domain-containing protein
LTVGGAVFHRPKLTLRADDGEEVIDAGLKGNAARFCNHSCGPNCKMVRFRLADYDEWQIGLFAAADIKKGAELTCTFFVAGSELSKTLNR